MGRRRGPAIVYAKLVGGEADEYEASTVSELADEMELEGNYSAQINGEPAEFSDALKDSDFVTFTRSVKAGS